MSIGASILGAHFGAYSFKNYVPVIAAAVVAAVVGEIAHNARTKRQQREQAQRLSRLRQQVRKQRMRRDLALLEAEKQEIEAMERRAAEMRHLYEPEAIEALPWPPMPRNAGGYGGSQPEGDELYWGPYRRSPGAKYRNPLQFTPPRPPRTAAEGEQVAPGLEVTSDLHTAPRAGSAKGRAHAGPEKLGEQLQPEGQMPKQRFDSRNDLHTDVHQRPERTPERAAGWEARGEAEQRKLSRESAPPAQSTTNALKRS